MNFKLICASLVGVSSIGGAVAGGMYLSKSETNKKDDSNTQGSQITQNKSEAPERTNLKPAETPKTVVSSGPKVGSPPQVTSSSGDSQEKETTLRA